MSSIVTSYDSVCAICGRPKTATHHLIFGSGLRHLADRDGIYIPICDECHTSGRFRIHDNPVAESLSKIAGQLAWEKDYYKIGRSTENLDPAREEFRKRYGRSYL